MESIFKGSERSNSNEKNVTSIANPWGLVSRTSFAPRSSSKRRRRAPSGLHSLNSADCPQWDNSVSCHMFSTTTPHPVGNDANDEGDSSSPLAQRQQEDAEQDDSSSPDCSAQQNPLRRRMRPAVSWMSVSEVGSSSNTVVRSIPNLFLLASNKHRSNMNGRH